MSEATVCDDVRARVSGCMYVLMFCVSLCGKASLEWSVNRAEGISAR